MNQARPTTDDWMRLLSGGFKFAPGTKLAHVMTAFRRELEEVGRNELQSHGSIDIKSHDGTIMKYTFNSPAGHWQQVL